jgi:hypothetical protein
VDLDNKKDGFDNFHDWDWWQYALFVVFLAFISDVCCGTNIVLFMIFATCLGVRNFWTAYINDYIAIVTIFGGLMFWAHTASD